MALRTGARHEGFRFAKLRYCDPVNLRSRIFHLIQRGVSKVPCIAVESTETNNLFTDPADRQSRTSSCFQEEPDSHEFARELAEIRTASASASAVLRMEAIGVTSPVRYFEIDLAEWEALDASGIVPYENAYAIDVPRLFYQRVALIDAFFRKEGILNAIELVADAETFSSSCDEEDQDEDDSDEADSTDERSGTIGESHAQRRTRELAVLGSRNPGRSTMMLSPQQEPEQGPPSSKPRSLLYSISFPPQRKDKKARPTARDLFNNRVEELWRKLLSNEIWEERSIERYVWEHYGDTLNAGTGGNSKRKSDWKYCRNLRTMELAVVIEYVILLMLDLETVLSAVVRLPALNRDGLARAPTEVHVTAPVLLDIQ
eukprot:g5229.t1